MTIATDVTLESLNEISRINEKTNLYELVPEKCRPTAKKMPLPVNTFHQSIFSFTSIPVTPININDSKQQIKKAKYAFLKIILRWKNELSDYYRKIHLSPTELERFQNLLRELMENNRLNTFKIKLSELGINSKTLNSNITVLESEIEWITTLPLIKKIKREKTAPIYQLHEPSKDDTLKDKLSPVPLAHPSFKRSKSETNIALLMRDFPANDDEHVLSEGEEVAFEEDKDILIELQAQCIINHCSSKSKKSKQKLLNKFSEISNPQVITSIAKLSSFSQLQTLINEILSNEDLYWKLGHIICGLDLKSLNQLIYEFDKHQIIRVNQVISNERYTSKDMICGYFKEKVIEWVDQCNMMDQKIDKLNYRLRFNVTGCNLTRNDLDIIKSYSDEVERLEVISRKTGCLIKGVVENREWMHVSTSGLQKEYLNLRTRLKEKHEYEGRVPGCVWGIIYRQAFERLFSNELQSGSRINYDEKDAQVTFPDWVITHAEDYRKVGLLGDISDDDFEKIQKDELPLKEISKTVLNRLGIEKIKHWKEKEIFNYSLFKEYLSKAEVRELVNATMKKLLTCD